MEKLAFNAAEAGDVLGVSSWTVYRLVEQGLLGKVPHLGKRVLISKVELERFTALGLLAEKAS